MDDTDLNINELYDKTRKGGQRAKNELFEALLVRLRAIAYQRIWNSADVEDIVQDALKTIADELDSLTIEHSFTAWAVKVLDYRILAYIKRKQTTQSRIVSEAPSENLHSAEQVSSELKLQLRRCLKELVKAKPLYARILNLHFQGFTIDEVCKKLKIKAGYSYVILSRARQMLLKCLGGDGE